MTALRVANRGRWIWTAFGLAFIAAVAVSATKHGHQPPQLFEYGCGAVVFIGAAFLVWNIDPAWTISAALALTVFSGNWQNLGLPGFPFLPDRFLLAGGILALLLRAPGARDRPRFERRSVHWLLALAAAYATVDAFAADTLTTNVGFFKLTDRFGLIPFLLFGISPLVYRTERQRRVLLGFMVGLGAYLGLTALFTTVGLNALVIPHYILDPNLGLSDSNFQGVLIGRARGPFLDAVSNGIAMFDCGIAAAVAVVLWRNRWARVCAGLVVVVTALGCLFTLQRTVWLAAVVAALAAMVWTPRLRRYVVPLVLGGAIATGLALAFIPGLQQRASTRLNDQWTVWDRANLQDAGVRMLAARPLLGFGWNEFTVKDGPYLLQPATYPLTAAGGVIHNTFLSNAVELGIIGVLLWLAAISAAVLSALRRRGPPVWRASLIAVVACWAITAALYPLPLTFPLTFLMVWLGVVEATGSAPDKRVVHVPRPNAREAARSPGLAYDLAGGDRAGSTGGSR